MDECYDRLRGPAENLTILATAYSSPTQNGTGRHEPMLMTITCGEGRVFHSTLGHDDYSFECVGFITTFVRGAEWAATGEVSIPGPTDFPTATETRTHPFPALP
ncbi:MAG: ThuA domain-containing protein [Candidatus Synoicihabitans palmerolidicus]|nr:ThuA domain-containing protein [Candidatus Synoicihabitans palmerolidicus]